jgi:hypothetical protein
VRESEEVSALAGREEEEEEEEATAIELRGSYRRRPTNQYVSSTYFF